MCKYCKQFGKDEEGNPISLKRKSVPLGVFGKGEVELELNVHGNFRYISAWFTYWDKGESIGGSIDINYCPMCGRKLKK